MKNIKILLTIIATTLWIWIIYNIATSPAPFIEQAPYCMFSTMAIFAVLSMLYKLIDAWEMKKS